MPYRVSRETLLLLAGLFWALAGVNVLRLGIRYWMDNPGYFLFKLSEMLVIFFVFSESVPQAYASDYSQTGKESRLFLL